MNDGTDIMRINMLVAGLMVAMIPALCVAVNDVKVSYLSAGSLSVVEVNTVPSYADTVFGIHLDTAIPSSDTETVTVLINLVSSASTTIPVDKNVSTISFDRTNWNRTVYVGLKSKVDAVANGNFGFDVTFTMFGSATTAWTKSPSTVKVPATYVDNDVAGVALSQTTLTVVEGGASTAFTVKLTSQPLGTVTLAFPNNMATHLQLSPGLSYSFTASNYNIPQTITVAAVQDTDANEPRSATFLLSLALTSTDPEEAPVYRDAGTYSISVHVHDDDKVLAITSICARGIVDADPRPMDGDFLVLNFTEPTNRVNMSSTEQVDRALEFSASIGSAYYGRWSDDSTSLTLTILDSTGAAPAAKVSSLAVRCKPDGGIRDQFNVVPAFSAESVTSLCGTWGGRRTFYIVAFGSNSGGQTGFGVNDTVHVHFNTTTNGMSLATNSSIDFHTVFRFIPSLGDTPLLYQWHSATYFTVRVGAPLDPSVSLAGTTGIGRIRIAVREPIESNPLQAIDVGGGHFPYYVNYGSDVYVHVDNTETKIESIQNGGRFVLLCLQTPVMNKQVVRVKYQYAALDHTKLVGTYGGAHTFEGTVDNYVGTPVVTHLLAPTPGDRIEVELDYPLRDSGAPLSPSVWSIWSFSLKGKKKELAVSSVVFASQHKQALTVHLKASNRVRFGERVFLSFTTPYDQSYTSLHGDLLSFGALMVQNSVAANTVALHSCVISDNTPNELTLTFEDPITQKTASVAFSIDVGNGQRVFAPSSVGLDPSSHHVALWVPDAFRYLETVAVSFSHGQNSKLWGAGGDNNNYVPSFTNVACTNNINIPIPTALELTVDDEGRVKVTFTENIVSGSTSKNDWSVVSQRPGDRSTSAHTITSVVVNSGQVRLELTSQSAIKSGANVSVSYQQPGAGGGSLRNAYGSAVQSFKEALWAKTNEVQTKLLFAQVDNAARAELRVVFDSPITLTTASNADFVVTVNNVRNAVTSHAIDTSTGHVVLQLQTSITASTQTVMLGYNEGSATYLKNNAGGKAGSFAQQHVFNGVAIPKLDTITVANTAPSVINVVFSGSLTVQSALDPADFVVKRWVNATTEMFVAVTGASIDTSTVELSVNHAFQFGTEFSVLYTKNTSNAAQRLLEAGTNLEIPSFPIFRTGANLRSTTCCTSARLNVANGLVVTLSLNDKVSPHVPITSDGYAVQIDGNNAIITRVQISAAGNIELVLGQQVSSLGQAVIAQYTHTNLANPAIISFTNRAISLYNDSSTHTATRSKANTVDSAIFVELNQGIELRFTNALNHTHSPSATLFKISISDASQTLVPDSVTIQAADNGRAFLKVSGSVAKRISNAAWVIMAYNAPNVTQTNGSTTNATMNGTNTTAVETINAPTGLTLLGGELIKSFSINVTIFTSPKYVSARVPRTTPACINITFSAVIEKLGPLVLTRAGTLEGTWGAYSTPAIASVSAVDSGNSPGISDGDQLHIVFTVPTNTPPVASHSEVETLMQFSSALGSNLTGAWTSPTSLSITIRGTTAVADPYLTQVNQEGSTSGLEVQILAKGGLVPIDGSTGVPSIARGYLRSGSWGAWPTPPELILARAEDKGNGAGLNDGDALLLCFDKPTNFPSLRSNEALEWFQFHTADNTSVVASIGNIFSGTWLNQTCFQLTVISTNLASLDPAKTRSCAYATAADPQCLRISMRKNNRIKSTDNSSMPAAGSVTVMGEWGSHATAPVATTLCGEDGGTEGVLDNGDRLVITFSKPPHRINVSSKVLVDNLLSFSGNIGNGYVGAWRNLTSLVITVTDITGAADRMLTTFNVLTLTIKPSGNLKTADLSSPAASGSVVLSCGSFGVAIAPSISSFSASNTGGGAGISNGDTLTIVFDQEVLTPSLHSKALVDSVFAFSTPIGIHYNGSFVSTTTAVITLHDISNGLHYTGTWFLVPIPGVLTWHNASAATGAGSCQCHSSTSPTQCICTSTPLHQSILTPGTKFTVQKSESSTETITLTVVTATATYVTYKGPSESGFVTPAPGIPVPANISHASNPFPTPPLSPLSDTAVGSLVVQVKHTAGLKSRDMQSLPSTAAAVLSGTYGAAASVPNVDSIEATNMGAAEGLNNGDEIIVTFDSDTSMISSNMILDVFIPSALKGNWELSFVKNDVIFSTGSMGAGGALQYSNDTEVESRINGLVPFGPSGVGVRRRDAPNGHVYRLTFSSCAMCKTLFSLSAKDSVSSTVLANAVKAVVSLHTLSKSVVNEFLQFSSAPGTFYSGVWRGPRTLAIIVHTAITGENYAYTRIGALKVRILSNVLYSADRSRVAASATKFFDVSGSWGPHAPPVMVAAVAEDPMDPPKEGLSLQDQLIIDFDKETNMPPVGSKTAIDRLFAYESVLNSRVYNCRTSNCFTPGADYEGTWMTPKRLKIRITDATMIREPGYNEEGNDGQVVTPEVQLAVGAFQLVLKSNGGLKSLDLSSNDGSGLIMVSGDWGKPHVAMQNIVQIFYMLALFGSAIACILFFAQAIYKCTCKAKDV